MRPLADFQRIFSQSILQPSLAKELTPDLNPAWLSRMTIHRANVAAALSNALRITFPSVAALLGRSRFDEIAAEYSMRFPPQGAVLYEFGAALPEFLKSRGDLADHPELVDLASFDWHIDLTGHRPMHVFGPPIALSGTVALRLDCSLCCLSASYEVDVLRDALSEDQSRSCHASPAGAAKASERCFVLWRASEGVMVKRVSKSSYCFASTLLAGHSAEESLAAALSASPDAPLTAIQELFTTSFSQIIINGEITMIQSASRWFPPLRAAIGLLDSIPYSAVALIARLATFSVFFRSGTQKLADWRSTLMLFENEYHVPIIPPHFAAYMAAGLELTCSVLILVGLLTRVATIALCGMVLVIQLFVYPNAWPDHIQWLAFMAILIARGPGILSVDHWIGSIWTRASNSR